MVPILLADEQILSDLSRAKSGDIDGYHSIVWCSSSFNYGHRSGAVRDTSRTSVAADRGTPTGARSAAMERWTACARARKETPRTPGGSLPKRVVIASLGRHCRRPRCRAGSTHHVLLRLAICEEAILVRCFCLGFKSLERGCNCETLVATQQSVVYPPQLIEQYAELWLDAMSNRGPSSKVLSSDACVCRKTMAKS